MTAHEGPLRCEDHGTVVDFGCPVWHCDHDHPLTSVWHDPDWCPK